MAIGNPINLTSNVESKNISVIATAGQTQFTVTGGYRINQISVFRNGVRLVDGRDFTALDGSIVTLLSAALVGDALEFQIFDDFRVADALSVNSGGTVNGNVTVTGILSTTNLSIGSSISLDATTGIITAVQVIGGTITGTATTAVNAQGLTGTPDITVNNIVAAAGTFSGVLTYEDVTNIDSLGIVTARTGVDITANGLVVNAGVSTFAANLSIADKIIHTGDSNTAIRFPSPDTFAIETTGIQRFEVNSTGDVGLVGIATATGLVVVAGSGIYAGHTGVITATTFDGSFTGNITGAASQVTVADESSDTTCFPLFTTAATGNLPPKSGTNLTFNSSTGALTATSFVGALTGNVTGNSAGTHTGAVDLNGGVLTLDADADTTITADTDDQIDIAFGGNDRITLSTGLIALKNDGSQSALRLYCESSNAHYAALQAPAHSAFSGNITLTLPATTDTLVGRTTTDTLTNKTLTSPTITGTGNIAGTFTGNVTGNTSGTAGGLTGTPNIDCGTGSFTGDVDIADKIIHTSDTNTAIRFPAADTFSVETAGTERLRITSDGKIGINQSTPQTTFHSTGTTNGQQATFGIDNSGLKISTFQKTDNDAGVILDAQKSSNGTLTFATAGTERLRIDSSGNGNFGAVKAVALPSGTGIQVYNSSTPRIKLVNDTTGNASGDGSYLYVSGSDFLIENKESANMRFYTSATEQLRIDSAGKVGININNPGSYNSAGNELVLGNTGNNGGMTIVSGTGNNGHIFFADGTSTPNQGIIKYEHANDQMAFNIATAEKLRITSAGITVTGTVSDSKGDLRKIIFKQESSAYTLVAADAGKAIEIATGGITVPVNVFGGGDAITIINDSTSDQTITQGSSVTMFNSAAGDGSSGNRTLAGRGMATIYFVNSSTCYISGAGLS